MSCECSPLRVRKLYIWKPEEGRRYIISPEINGVRMKTLEGQRSLPQNVSEFAAATRVSPSLGPLAQEHLLPLSPRVSRKHCLFLCVPWCENLRIPGRRGGGSHGGGGTVWPGHCITKTIRLEAVTWACV